VNTPGKYLEIPLPEEVASFEGANIGEKSFYAHLEIEDNLSYLRFTPENDSSRHYLRLKKKSGSSPSLAVSLPAEYAIYNDQSPFKGLGHGDRVNIEIREEEDEIRVYTPDDFPKRLMQLSERGTFADFDKPLIAPVLPNKRTFTNLSKDIDCRGQKFHIMPFYGQQDAFVDAMIKRGEYSDERLRKSKPDPFNEDSVFTGNPFLIDYVREKAKYDLAILKADEIRVYHRFLNWEDGTAMSSEGQGLIYQERDTKCSKVILPDEGQYLIEAEKNGYLTRVSMMPNPASSYQTFLDGWTATQFYNSDDDEDPPQILLPIPAEGKGEWKTCHQLEPSNFKPNKRSY
jgi:hypothetical protein